MAAHHETRLPIPEAEHVLIHARLKGLSHHLGSNDYAGLSQRVLDSIRATSPQSIAVPTFTYSFTETLKFSVAESPSEVGRFSEEVRLATPPKRRTKDPIFSVVDVDAYGWAGDTSREAFGPLSLWKRWQELNGVIVNLDLPHIVATQFHFIEKLARVPYRFSKTFSGEFSDADGNVSEIDYDYFVRNLETPSTWDRQRLEEEVRKAGALHQFDWQGVRGAWFRARDVEQVLLPIMLRDPQYLLGD